MDLRSLRRRALLALGLPLSGATWAACQPPPNPELPDGPQGTGTITVTETPTPSATPEDAPPETHGCGNDRIREMVCGQMPDAEECSRSALGLEEVSTEDSRVYVTDLTGDARATALKEFELDDAATREYRLKKPRDETSSTEGECCYSRCTKLRVASVGDKDVPPGFVLRQKCIPAPETTSKPASDDPECPAAVQFGDKMAPLAGGEKGQCCYSTLVARPTHYRLGRPLRVHGNARTTPSRASDAWIAEEGARPGAREGLSEQVRSRLADAWLDAAALEHASIGAFSKLSLWLIALGAGPDLLRDASAAAIDEVRHAEIAYTLAAAYGGAPRGPAPFAEATGMFGDAAAWGALVAETILDGCVGEAAAAIEAGIAAAEAEDPVVRAALTEIARDESRHAELAFRILAWAARTNPAETRAEVAIAAAALDAELACPTAAFAETASLVRHGILDADTRADVRRRVIAEIALPALSGLLGSLASGKTLPYDVPHVSAADAIGDGNPDVGRDVGGVCSVPRREP